MYNIHYEIVAGVFLG